MRDRERGAAWFEPTVLTDVDHRMTVMRDESFGPIIGVQRVEGDAEAVTLMNDTEYGLTAGVYSTDEARARNVLSAVNAGSGYWNCCDRVSPGCHGRVEATRASVRPCRRSASVPSYDRRPGTCRG